ncbi:FmdB family zinc ribbon protein [Desulfonauticus submarinus]|uniref:Putative regulatory protein, FmdB family n=1 Tax=Desulfonauticus submarinus TaxID=206665 RepID=A0A1H0D382_9BACT|nr:zinc ribbon domain-containing protein [Desulfonauticus submarinus]SDN64568.1 putative regulatory protein, FmdB family [Desulfonauticus submarinus]
MPIYEFVCQKCGEEFEELVLKEDSEVFCPKCHSKEVNKLMSACRFKTGGPIVLDSSKSAAGTSSGSKSSCAGCSGGNCSTCGL